MKYLLALISLTAFTCEVTSYQSIYKVKENLDEKIIKKSTCASEINDEIIRFFSLAQGKIRSSSIQNYIKSKTSVDITYSPRVTQISDLKEKLKDHIGSDAISISRLNLLSAQNSLNLDNNKLQIDCQHCMKSGLQNIKFSIADKNIWASALIKIKRKVLIVGEQYISSGQTPSVSQIKQSFSHDVHPSQIFTDFDNIQYYKANKNLAQNHIIKKHDLTPIKLIKPGQVVKLHISNKGLSLQSKLVSKAYGSYGDMVELVNPKSNKKVYAKVVGINKAEVQL